MPWATSFRTSTSRALSPEGKSCGGPAYAGVSLCRALCGEEQYHILILAKPEAMVLERGGLAVARLYAAGGEAVAVIEDGEIDDRA